MTPELAHAPFRALVLEDHDFQRRVAVQVLKDCGATEVLEAAEGAAALDLIEHASAPVDLVLCDLNMPGMDGLAFLRHLAGLAGSAGVILVSALESAIIRSAEIMAEDYGLHIIGVVEKPISRAKVTPLIARYFRESALGARVKVQPLEAEEIVSSLARGEFAPYYQPKVDLRTGMMAGAEALMRCHHPERGLVLPEAFIPTMELNGLLPELSLTLLDISLEHAKRWRAAGMEVPIAINFSAGCLTDTGLPDILEQRSRAAGFTPDQLTIEITETLAITDIGHSLETLARCRMKGFGLSIDDYGTGFSSMQQLTRLPLSELKIDRSFVTGASKASVLRAMIETSVRLAEHLDLTTVAEGVESHEDWDLVSQLGCTAAQGYFIARPMPAEDLPGWYRAWRGTTFHSLQQAGARATTRADP
jgi:EAL domain-containing protein (putative c-di-GMP-specific phosphodiesterase class I)/AmiR/NasT family two-component response regulator